MVRLASSREYIGAVGDPETGERVQLSDDVSPAVADRLAAHYHYLSVVEDSGSGVTSTDSNQEYPTNDDGEPLCTGKDDGQCGRTVDEPFGECWQHES